MRGLTTERYNYVIRLDFMEYFIVVHLVVKSTVKVKRMLFNVKRQVNFPPE